jgi:hypothetical protein
VLSYPFRVRTTIRGVGLLLDELLGPFRAAANGHEGPTYDLVSGTGLPSSFAVHLDGECVESTQSLADSLGFVLWTTNARAIDRTADYVALHSAAVSWEGRGMVFPAPPDSGKTTLAAGLTRSGFDYLTDEAGLIDPTTRQLVAFPRSLAMEPSSVDIVPGLRGDLPADFHRYMGDSYFVPPDRLRPGSIGSSCPIRYVIFPSYRADSPTQLEPISKPQALRELAENCFNFRTFGGRALEILGAVVKEAECYRLQIGDLRSAVRTVRDLVGAG